jgi:anti-sigma factor RsiW
MNTNHTTDKHLLYLSHELPSEEAADVREHLQECANCRADAEQLRKLLRLTTAGPEETVSPLTRAKIASAAHRELSIKQPHIAAPVRKPLGSRSVRYGALVCAFSAVIVVAALLQPFTNREPAHRRNEAPAVAAAPKPAQEGRTSVMSPEPSSRVLHVRRHALHPAPKAIPVTRMYATMYPESSVDSDLRYMRSRLAKLALLVSDKEF